MSKIWFTSDNHFFHTRILEFQAEYKTRQGSTADEMNELMIEKWNSQVAKADTVYCLGDFSLGKTDNTEKIIQRLNGQIHLIKGNHDYWYTPSMQKYFVSVSYYKEITIDGIKIVLFHYPIMEWNKMHYGSFMLHGHVHGKPMGIEGRILDAGIDARPQKDMGLFSWEEVKELLLPKEIKTHHPRMQAET